MTNPSISLEFGEINPQPGLTVEICQQLMNYVSFRQGTYSSYRNADTHIHSLQRNMTISSDYVQHEMPTDILRTRDDYQSILELAAREWAGYGTLGNQNAAIARWTMLAFAAPNVSRSIKARAHSCLAAAWLDRATEVREKWNIDSLYRAASNANDAISLGLISPGALRTAFVIENAGFRRPEDNRFPELSTDRFEQLTELWEALDMRKEEMDRASAKRDAKVSKDPLKYICSAPDCGIQATKKAGLLQCAGKCSVTFKPSYCSRECQKMDWKRHKPLCKADATRSSVDSLNSKDDTEDPTLQRGTLSHDVGSDKFEGRASGHSIDMPMKDGGTIQLNSKTLGPKTLRGLRKFAEDNEVPSSSSRMRD